MAKNHFKIKGEGNKCPKCKKVMERRERIKMPKNKTYYFTEWDYCLNCKFVQHYDEFKSFDWQEDERQQSFLRSI